MAGGVENQAVVKMCLACNREFDQDIARCPYDNTALITLKQEGDWIGKTLADRYDVTELIGKGGMGVVYLARHRMMDRWVAIKMLQAELTQDELSVKRFQQEAKAASCLNHPHLVTLHDYGITPTGQPYLVMEYLQGCSLLEVIKLDGPISCKRAVKIFCEVADGLAHAHHQGIVHRDMKPSNVILLEQEGDPEFVKVVDFGLAKLMPWSGKESQHLTKTGEVFGSPIYMSPEQCMGRELRPTSDVYSLGITLFEALTGKPPFRGASSIQTASKHMNEPPPHFADVRPDLYFPDALEKVVLTCLAKEPADRFQSMQDFKDALRASLSSESINPGLRVSQRGVQAVASTTAIPALKVEQDKVREQAKPDKQRLIIAALAAVAGIGAVAGGGLFFAMNASGTKYAAEISSLDRRNGIIEFIDVANKDPHQTPVPKVPLHLSQEAVQELEKRGESMEHSGLGARVEAAINDHEVKSIRIIDEETPAALACKAVSELLEDYEFQDPIKVAVDKSIDINKVFSVGDRRPVRNVPGGTVSAVHVRPATAIQIVESDPNRGTTVRVNKGDYFVNPAVLDQEQHPVPVAGRWLVRVDKDYKIISINNDPSG